MSFGVFSSKFGSDDVSLDMAIEHEHPDNFRLTDDGGGGDIGVRPPDPILPSLEEPTRPSVEPPLPVPSNLLSNIPWALVIPAAVIGVAAIGIGWYMLGGKKAEIPV